GIARVHDQRQPGLARRRNVMPEVDDLLLARAVLVVVVEAALPDADDPGMCGALQERRRAVEQLDLGLVRMDADAAPDVAEPLGDREHAGELVQPGADADAGGDAGVAGPFHHRVELRRERIEIEMTMGIDQHHSAPARRVVSPRMRAAPSTVWRGSRCRVAVRSKLRFMASRASTQRSSLAPPFMARARMRSARACTRKAPNVS